MNPAASSPSSAGGVREWLRSGTLDPVSSFFPTRDHSGDAWFRLGRVEVTSTTAVVIVGAISMLVGLFVPSVLQSWAFTPSALPSGMLWTPFTWPLVNAFSLWEVLSLFMLWYFGNDLERTIGRRPMLTLLLGTWAVLTLTTLVLGLVLSGSVLAGLRMVQFAVLLLWIAEYPNRRFLFNIPAWVFGAIILALQVLPMLAYGQFGALLSFVVSLLLIAMVARRVGLLSEQSWIPGARRRAGAAPRPSRAQRRESQRRASDQERMDDLLDKISAEGIHALSKAERAELERLRQRRRR